jgi:hypothetical protein
LRIILGGGVEYNAQFSEAMQQDIRGYGIMGHGALGIAKGRFSVIGTLGYANNIEGQIINDFPSYGIHPITKQRMRIGGTTETIDITDKLLQPGLKVGLDITKWAKIAVGTQYNMVESKTAGIVFQEVMDDNGNKRSMTRPLEGTLASYNYWTAGPTLGFKTNFKGPIDIGVDFNAYFPINPKSYSNQNLINSDGKPSFSATGILYFGKAQGYSSKSKVQNKKVAENYNKR